MLHMLERAHPCKISKTFKLACNASLPESIEKIRQERVIDVFRTIFGRKEET
tara:strand:+ start:890 stop:1045 length:156 start_codon:yes stop_codon:yes gene_type:complete